jgi:trans-aconitate methyltransferase
MNPHILGQKYDTIARWWHEYHQQSDYGVAAVEKAISYCQHRISALDVGCGSGGRIIHRLLNAGFRVRGIDVSEKMIAIARTQHPAVDFHVADICHWHGDETYDLIVAWDSLFHLPLPMQVPVLTKLCQRLRKDGILLYTFGDAVGEHESSWHNDTFYYSSIGIDANLRVLMENGGQCRHLELDQYPMKHVYLIGQKVV